MSVRIGNNNRDYKSVIGSNFDNKTTFGSDFSFIRHEDTIQDTGDHLIDPAILASFGIISEPEPFTIGTNTVQGHTQGHGQKEKEKDVDNTESFSSEGTNDSLDSATTATSAVTGTSTSASSVTVLDSQQHEHSNGTGNSSVNPPAKSSLRRRFSQPLPMLAKVKDSPTSIPSPTRKAPPKSLDLSLITTIPPPTLERLPSIFLICPTPTATPPPTPPPHAPQMTMRLPTRRDSLQQDNANSVSPVQLLFEPEEIDPAIVQQQQQKTKEKNKPRQVDGDNGSVAGSRRSVSSFSSAFKRLGLAMKKLPFVKAERSVEGHGRPRRSSSSSEGFKAPPPMKRRASFFNPRPLTVIEAEHTEQGTSQPAAAAAEAKQRKRASTVGRQAGNRLNPMAVPANRRRDRALSNASLDGMVAEIRKNEHEREEVDETGRYSTVNERPPTPNPPPRS